MELKNNTANTAKMENSAILNGKPEICPIHTRTEKQKKALPRTKQVANIVYFSFLFLGGATGIFLALPSLSYSL